ncbi:hypothetical protein NLJ89_g8976 [Agrocybe chaxingu]|uniref:Uncharacterized protein n=1 Tax=Agrocybe chaxingu TaxID=84603 RepID=A0A9W8MU02_9AGAR|nr:hypothetical protein NLJ89_g8976 [Agrocybe chaxingu]
MRRAQSTRHYPRPSLALAADDLGVLREGDESDQDVLRRQLLDKDRECDKLQLTIQALQDQLARRPPIEHVQALEREFKNLELLLQGTQRENEKCMADLDSARKNLERELARLAGENWQSNLEVPLPPSGTIRGMHQRSNTINSPIVGGARRTHSPSPSPRADAYHHPNASPGAGHTRNMSRSSIVHTPTPPAVVDEEREAAREEMERQRLAQLEQTKLLILGMQQRLEIREEKLVKMVEKAENESRRFEGAAVELKAHAA